MREALIDGVVRVAGTDILRAIPIGYLPPCGAERQRFASFLRSLPKGGLGFHATASRHIESLHEFGLNPNYAPDFSMSTIYYEVLDPETDPLIAEARGMEGIVATHHRLKNGLNKLILKYGETQAAKFNAQESPDEPYKATVVVFSNAWGLANVTQEKDRKSFSNNQYYASKRDYDGPAMRARLNHRMFYIPRGMCSYNDPGSVDDLPVAEAHIIPPQNIVDIFVGDEVPSTGMVFKMPDYVSRMSERIVSSLVERYTPER